MCTEADHAAVWQLDHAGAHHGAQVQALAGPLGQPVGHGGGQCGLHTTPPQHAGGGAHGSLAPQAGEVGEGEAGGRDVAAGAGGAGGQRWG